MNTVRAAGGLDSVQRAAIYARVSSEEQVENTSLDLQVARCTDFCRSRGWPVVAEFVEEGVSGARQQRPQLDRLLDLVRAGEVDTVVVLKLDRFSRDRAHLFDWLAEFARLRVAFVSVTEAFDTSTAHGDAMVGMLGVFAQMERRVIADRTRAGLEARLRAGGWGGGDNAPYGYRIVGQDREAHLEVDPHEKRLIETAVSLLLDQGLTSGQAAARLNAMGLTPRQAALWTSQNLRNLLRRNQFDGVWVFGKPAKRVKRDAPITVQVEPILPPERVAAVRAYLDRTALVRGKANTHPLSGRLFCRCGAHMTGIARGDRANRRYRCRFGRHEPGRPFCNEPSLLADRVDEAVWAEVVALLENPAMLRAAAQERVELLATEALVEGDALTEATRRTERAREALAQAAAKCLAAGLDAATTDSTIAHLRETYMAAKEREQWLAGMAQQTERTRDRVAAVSRLADVARERLLHADRELRAKVLALLEVRVTVLESARGKHATVRLRVTGSVAHELLLRSTSEEWHPPGGAGAAG